MPTTTQPPRKGWTTADMPSLEGRLAIVTGANSGLGLQAASALARHGAAVTLAVRDRARGEQAAAGTPGNVEVAVLDLADLASVRAFAADWSARHPEGLDLLLNNAGIMAVPRSLTVDGFESQLGTNHLGHFALTGLLLPALVARPGARVVTVSSMAHRMGRMDFDDLTAEAGYRPWQAYGQSKLANLLFTSELQRRLDVHGIRAKSMAAHPGYSATNLGHRAQGRAFMRLSDRLFAQSAEMGALPLLYAATVAGLPGNTYVGPDGVLEQRGHPTVVGRSARAQDAAAAARLWDLSEELTGVRFPL